VCGEQDAWDGAECAVCGFIAPPAKFQDPDVDAHKNMDLRDNDQLHGGDVQGLEQSINDADRDGLDDNTGLPVDDQIADEEGALDQQPQLQCSNCGATFDAGHPVSTNTAAPQGGDTASDGPSDGDLCPACGKGLLESGTELAEQGGDPEADPNAVPDEDPDPHADEEGMSTDEDKDGIPDAEDPDADGDGIPDKDEYGDAPSDSADQDDDEDDDPDSDEDAGPVRKPKPPFKR
jgi:hypothetical protein